MTDDREPRAGDPRAISGGSLQEAELQAAPDVWRATAARSNKLCMRATAAMALPL